MPHFQVAEAAAPEKAPEHFAPQTLSSTENITARKEPSESNVEYVKPIAWRLARRCDILH